MATSMEQETETTTNVLSSSKGEDTCKMCQKEQAKYTCPRCNLRYCSSGCYRAERHLQCSEAFYRECFMQGLNDVQVSNSERSDMLAMLNRLEQENPLDSDDDSDDEEDLADRIAGLDLDADTDQIWERLTAKEKAEFKAMVQQGHLVEEIQPWQPWWQTQPRLVEEIEESAKSSQKTDIPPILDRFPVFSEISKKEASPCIKYTVINLLYGYAYVARVHNGDHLNNAAAAAQELTELCCGLQSQPLTSTAAALTSCILTAQQNKGLFQSSEFSVAVIQDVLSLIEGGQDVQHVTAALSDLHRLLSAARQLCSKELKQAKADSVEAKELSSQKRAYFNHCKKLEFLLSWTQSHGGALLECLPEIQVEFCSMSTELVAHRETQEKVEQSMSKLKPKKNRLIEEIS